ncbi:hypothetical protein [Nitrospirillum iridis]|uniref:Uncharacterized protein n=1 Tax=Nitrospirillum iridis TaxID=765888 RepID=A0A7X0AWX9_9PROT|nr:hypothetical protein [Nitrospirillum iridis]MBB6251628.1 hypothetical protein [Nitrospirillum iridis]
MPVRLSPCAAALLLLTLSFPPTGAQAQAATPPAFPKTADTSYTAALYILDGQVVKARSTPAAVSGGDADGGNATGITVKSDTTDLNGVFVRGSDYTVADSHITLSGNGSDDFVGLGAGAMIDGGGTLVLRKVDITTDGLIRPATMAADHGVLKVYDSTLRANGGILPPDYKPRIGPGMAEPPAGLHIGGTARAALTVGNGQSYFYRSTIIANGWGALSTDAADAKVYVEADHSIIQVQGPGYGVYADSRCQVVLNHTSITAQTFDAIMAGVSTLAWTDVTARSEGNGVMVHNVMGTPAEVATLSIKDGTLETGGDAILVRSANLALDLEGATVKPWNGVLLRSVISDDPFATKVNGQAAPGIVARFAHMIVTGDVLHQDKDRPMVLELQDTVLKGRILAARVKLGAGARWTATADSTVTLLDAIAVDGIDAPSGITITAAAGPGTTLKGIYKLASGGMLKVD